MTTGSPSSNPVFDTGTFIKTVFNVTLSPNSNGADANGDFATYVAALSFNNQMDDPGPPGTTGNAVGAPGAPVLSPQMAEILSKIGSSSDSALPAYFSKGKCRDTSLGGNDAINCYPQFNETDDVAEHPFLVTNSGTIGMGRVYSEVYDDQQQILYLTFGIPRYNSITNFYGKAVVTTLAQLMNSGTSSGTIGRLLDTAINVFVSIPVLPLVFVANLLTGGVGGVPITKYYEFQSSMPLYYRCVNSMINHLTINLGISKDAFFAQTPAVANITMGGATDTELVAAANTTNGGTSTQGLPDLFKNFGFDIYRIMLKKYKYDKTISDIQSVQSSDDALIIAASQQPPVVADDENYAQNFLTSFEGTLYDASLYVGFRVEKGVDTSESFSNETGESSIAQQVNQKAQQARDAKFSVAGGNIDGSSGFLSSAISAIGGILSGAADAIGGVSIDNVLAGAGNLDFPDVWKSSSFSKSYHFNMSLRSPYGDSYSILQNLYIPLSLLLGGALPRGIGAAAYTSPFVCRAYCKGMFAVPLGMITSMTIKRGADQFGWTTSKLPTCIDISFEIKDLSPAMYLALGDNGTWADIKNVFGANSSFQEYLMTLSGMGLRDRINWFKQLKNKVNFLLGQIHSTKLNPFYAGNYFGSTLAVKTISHFIPTTNIPQN
jgi:hypothetical protein